MFDGTMLHASDACILCKGMRCEQFVFPQYFFFHSFPSCLLSNTHDLSLFPLSLFLPHAVKAALPMQRNASLRAEK